MIRRKIVVKSIRKTHLMILGLALTATVTAGASASQCRTVAECRARIAQDQATLKHLQSLQMPAFLDIAVTADGRVKTMNHGDAIEYCARQGARLPSARELAQLAMNLGAKGIVDACDASDDKCYLLSATNADGSSDNFNFSYAGYSTVGDLGNLFWSSSINSSELGYAFILDTRFGQVALDRIHTNYIAVRCVSGR